MPEILPIGWFHTAVGLLAIGIGFYTFAKHKVFSSYRRADQLYLLCTFLAAGTALMIFQRGAFGPAHTLAILALVALFGGLLVERTSLFGKFAPYLQALAFTGTFLCHMLPAITDGLMRLPIGDPVVTDFKDPLLQGFIKAFGVSFLLGVMLQWRWLAKQNGVSRQSDEASEDAAA